MVPTTLAGVAAWIIGAGAVAGAVAAVVALIRKMWRFARRVGYFLDDIAGEPGRPGVEPRPGIMERLAGIEHEVRRNDGTSLKDSVARTEKNVNRLDGRVSSIAGEVDELRTQVHHLSN